MNKKIIWLLLFSMSTAFRFAVDDNQMNYLLIGIMSIAAILFFFQFHKIDKSLDILIILFISLIVLSALFHIESFRISTILYTTLFVLNFSYYLKLIKKEYLSPVYYIRIVKFIIYSYFIVLVIQQMCVLFGLPFVVNYIAGIRESLKLNSLGPEPSHSSRFVLLAFLSFIAMREIILKRKYNFFKDGKKDIFIWIVFMYTMFSFRSGFAVILVIIFLLRFINLKSSKGILLITPIILFSTFFILNSNYEPVLRVKNLADALLTMDISRIMYADHSASVRIVPVLIYFSNFSITNFNFWFGHGTDFTINYIPQLMAGIPEGARIGGFFPAFFFDRGLIPFLVFGYVVRKYCIIKIISLDTLILVLSIFSVGINTQLFWFALMLFATNKYIMARNSFITTPAYSETQRLPIKDIKLV